MTTTAPAPTQRVVTPTARSVVRRSIFWVVAAVFAVVVALLGIAFAGSTAPSDPLSASNPAPAGAKALVEVLRQQGVTVTATDSLAETRAAVASADDTTLFYYDPSAYLDQSQRLEAFALADTVVAVDPDFDQLLDLSPDIAQAGAVDGALEADCALDAAANAETITGDGFGYRYTGDSTEAVECFATDDGAYSLVGVPSGEGIVYVTGATAALSNETIAARGNAAFALTLLGSTDTLVWYLPGVDDLAGDAAPTLGELSPGWVLPLTSLLLVTAIAAALWRGRRFGPLIVENLPVTVRANETMQGRARLYAKSGARLHALDSLRIGTVDRLARLCGLPRVATVDEVVSAVAAVTGADEQRVRRILVADEPTSDRDLVRMSDDLLTLERAVATSVTPH
jgi:hypothetical protein